MKKFGFPLIGKYCVFEPQAGVYHGQPPFLFANFTWCEAYYNEFGRHA